MPRRLTNLRRWVSNPHPTTLVDWLKQKHRRNLEDQTRATAYALWEADGKPEGKEQHYWQRAIEEIKQQNRLTARISRPINATEKHLEGVLTWMKSLAILEILGLLGNLTIFIGLLTYIAGEKQRRDTQVYQAWQVITAAYGQPGSGGRKEALEFLNSQPRRFPWFWMRWERQSLYGLAAPEAHLLRLNIPYAYLVNANLRDSDLRSANLQNSLLAGANLQHSIMAYANLHKAVATNANLQKTNIRRANLKEADLWKANLQGAALTETAIHSSHLW